jgi:hypothetical protein
MSSRSEVRPALERLIVQLRARRYPVDNALLRLLRDYGLDCRDIGWRAAHDAPTVRVPPTPADSEITGRYSIEHPNHEDPK